MDLMEKIVSLTKRRGFVFPSSEIYGGFSSSYDFGPQGVELKNNLKKAWWEKIVLSREEVVGLDAAILMSPKVWQASGHLSAGFADEMVECSECHRRFRLDHLTQGDNHAKIKKSKTKDKEHQRNFCPECGGKLSTPRKFNLMMQTYVGPVEDKASKTYLRAETCQGIYVNFENVYQSQRLKLPFGIAQIGKAFRNEITPGNFIFRMREFEQMEMEYFIKPGENEKWFEFWKEERMKWYLDLGLKKENLRFSEHKKEELAHYARRGGDIEYKFPFGWQEIEGIHDRGDWDLSNHSKFSGHNLSYFDDKTKKRFIPHIIETSCGVERLVLTFLLDAYHEEMVRGEKRVVLKIDKRLAPVKLAILPLVRNKLEIVGLARKIFEELKNYFPCLYDDSGSIGRLYRRQDEIGTPYCLTVDFQSLEDKKVTIRDRDTMLQERVEICKLKEILTKKLAKK